MRTAGYIGIAALVAGTAGLIYYLNRRKKEDEKKKEDANVKPVTSTPKPGTVKPVTTNVNAPKFVGPPASQKPSDVGFMGTKVFAGPSGADAYKSASASQVNIEKYFGPGKYIGTVLAPEGIYTKITMEVTGIFSNSFKPVWVLTKDLTT